MNRDFPVGKAQQTILNALGLHADGFNAADQLFADLGIAVRSVRQGRTSVPVVTLQSSAVFNEYGEGVEIRSGLTKAQYDAIAQWIS